MSPSGAVQESRGQTFFTFTARPPGCQAGGGPPPRPRPLFLRVRRGVGGSFLHWLASFTRSLCSSSSHACADACATHAHTAVYAHRTRAQHRARSRLRASGHITFVSLCMPTRTGTDTRGNSKGLISITAAWIDPHPRGRCDAATPSQSHATPSPATRRGLARRAQSSRAQELKSSRAQELESSEPRAQRSPSSEDAELREERLDLLRQGPGRLDAHDSVGLCHGLGDWKVGLEG